MGSASRVTVSLWPFSCKCNGAKNIASPVAGRADILLVPDLDSGDILAKQLEYLAGAQIAGIVLGARIPIVLTSRADKTPARLASCATALLLARNNAGSELLGAGLHSGWNS